MKNLLLTNLVKIFLLLFFINTPKLALSSEIEYNQRLYNCEAEYIKHIKKNVAFEDIGKDIEKQIALLSNVLNCYEKLTIPIVEKHFSKNSTQVKSLLKTFKKDNLNLMTNIFFKKDACPESCGRIDDLNALKATTNNYKNIILQILLSIDRTAS